MNTGKKVALVGLVLLFHFLFTSGVHGQKLRVFSPKHVTEINPQGIVTGGYDLYDSKYGKVLSDEEVDQLYREQDSLGRWEDIVSLNPFISPGVRGAGTRDYYGSGDSDGDGDVDGDDIEYITSGGESNYRCDTNGDGILGDQEDVRIIWEFVSGARAYMPSHWNYLNNQEKLEWFLKMVELDDTNVYRDGWTCGEYANRFVLAFAGLKNPEGHGSFDHFNNFYFEGNFLAQNGMMNLPVYRVTVTAGDDNLHGICAILLGDDPLIFSDWYFIEPQTDRKVYPGSFSMRNQQGDRVAFSRLEYYQSPADGEWRYNYVPTLTYEFNETGEPELIQSHPHLIDKHPGNPVTNIENNTSPSPDIIGNPYPNPWNGQMNLKIPYSRSNLEARLVFSNILGQRIFDEKYDSNSTYGEFVISPEYVASLPNGSYFLTISNNEGTETTKVRVVK
jgi:hypothetical protein